jgi:hypothetical protein
VQGLPVAFRDIQPDRSSMALRSKPAAELGLLERYALRFLRRWNRRQSWAARPLTSGETSEVRRTERLAIVLASFAGVASGAIFGTMEVVLGQQPTGGLELALWREQWRQWGWFVAVAVVVSGAEIVFIYWNALRAAGRISAIAGLSVTGAGSNGVVPVGLARAALELPNPREPVVGIDPYVRTARWKLVLFALLYRLKVGATSFLVRVFLRRLLARAALRFFIPFVAIPVYAVWNAVITAWSLRQVRARSFGPAAVRRVLEEVFRDPSALDDDARRTIVSGVAEIIILNADAHPNFVLLVEGLLRELALSAEDVRIDWDSHRDRLARLDEPARDTALAVFRLAAVIDGRLHGRELRFLEEAYRLCGLPFDEDAVRARAHGFLEGRGIAA